MNLKEKTLMDDVKFGNRIFKKDDLFLLNFENEQKLLVQGQIVNIRPVKDIKETKILAPKMYKGHEILIAECPSCGAPGQSGECAYCGTKFSIIDKKEKESEKKSEETRKKEINKVIVTIAKNDKQLEIIFEDTYFKKLATDIRNKCKFGENISILCTEKDGKYSASVFKHQGIWEFPEQLDISGNVITPAVRINTVTQTIEELKVNVKEPNIKDDKGTLDNGITEYQKELKNLEEKTAKAKQSIFAKLLKLKNKEIKNPQTEKDTI